MNKSQKLLFKLENMNIFFFSKQKGRHSTKRLTKLAPDYQTEISDEKSHLLMKKTLQYQNTTTALFYLTSINT